MQEFDLIVPDKEVKTEQVRFEANQKLRKFKNHSLFPIQWIPTSRDFERLVYYLFNSSKGQETQTFDDVWLMRGTKDKGRDVILRREGRTIGIIQCKKLASPIAKGQFAKEFIAFVIHHIASDLFANNAKIEYYMASTAGLTEDAKEFIDLLNNQEFEETGSLIEKTVVQLTVDTRYKFNHITFAEIKNRLYACLSALKITSLDGEELSHRLDGDPDVASKFFQLDKVIDLASFSEMLFVRESKMVNAYNELSNLEKELSRLDIGLAHIFSIVKAKTDALSQQYSSNFLTLGSHKRSHGQMMLKIASFFQPNREGLNAEEILILLMSLYLTDIGICQPFEDSLDGNISLRDTELSVTFIEEHGNDALSIPLKYITPVKLLVGVLNGTLIHPDDRGNFNNDYSVEPFSIHKVNLLYLGVLVWLADLVDFRNLNARMLLYGYENYPAYGISISIWNEIDLNVHSDINNETLHVSATSQIDDQLIYLGLCKKMEGLKSAVEIANSIVIKEKKHLNLKFVSNDLRSSFRRRIGITVDANNILATLLGKKLYPKEIDAVREIVQNAIDACNYPSELNEVYEPRIDISYDRGLTVRDNGIGMDEDVVSNYFAKVGRSYHTERQNERIIGQFGIGVFSYFMLNGTFTVETKKSNAEALKFKVDQNSPDMFYFYKEAQLRTGTSIIFEEMEFQISPNDLEEYLRLTFKYSNIPIFFHESQINLVEEPLLNEINYVIDENVKIENRELFREGFRFAAITYNTDDIEGWVGAFYPSKPGFFDIRQKFSKGLNYYNKGVFVRGGSTLCGELNFKKGLPLKMDRNDFERTRQFDILSDQILAALYERMFSESLINPSFLTHFFIRNYGGGHKDHSTFYRVDRLLYPFAFLKQQALPISLYQIRYGKHDIELLGCEDDIFTEPIRHSQHTESIVIPIEIIYNDSFFIKYFDREPYIGRIANLDSASVYRFTVSLDAGEPAPQKIPVQIGQSEFVEFEDQLLATLFSHTTYFNLKNPLCIYLISISDDPSKVIVKRELVKLFNEIASILLNAFSKFRGTIYQANLLIFNKRLEDINARAATNFSLDKEDFPVWMRSHIK